MYDYETEKPKVFSEEGQRMFLSIRDRVFKLIAVAGAVRMDRAISDESGDSWAMLACVDRLVELKEIKEIPQGYCVGQYRIFTKYD